VDVNLDRLMDDYDTGAISRRGLMALLAAALVTPTKVRAGAFTAKSLNHVTLAVSDIERSRKFYETVMGASVVSTQSNGVNLGLGDGFLGLYQLDSPPGIHHFCVGLDNFDVKESAVKLEQLGLDPYVREDKPEVYFQDPDGITVQFENKNYRG
jgi:catechol 2,3-dioxygenase-like lactoylglutathione lyase family enzyme